MNPLSRARTLLHLSLISLWCCEEPTETIHISTPKEYKIASFRGVYVNGRIQITGVDTRISFTLADSLVVSDSTLSWSPNGVEIVFASNYQISVLNFFASVPITLTDGPYHHAFPVFSPNGVTIAFQSDRSGKNEIYTVSSNGANLKRITTTALGAQLPAWSPNGYKIAYMGDGGIHIANFDGSGDRQLTNQAEDSKPLWSPRGDRILFVSRRDGNSEVYVINEDGTGQQNLTLNSASDDSPSWSPAGLEIAFVSERNQEFNYDGSVKEQRREIYTMDSDGSRLRRLTTDAYVFAVGWSPEASMIIYDERSPIYRGLYLISVFGGKSFPFIGGYSPAWSPEPSAANR